MFATAVIAITIIIVVVMAINAQVDIVKCVQVKSAIIINRAGS